MVSKVSIDDDGVYSGECQLYRHFDKHGSLLYVGISLSALGRLQQHKKARWISKVTKVTIEVFESREVALMAEAKAIKDENPTYNIQKSGLHKCPNKPKWFDSVEYCGETLPSLVYGSKETGGIIFNINGSWSVLESETYLIAVNNNILKDLLDIATSWFDKWKLSEEGKHYLSDTSEAL